MALRTRAWVAFALLAVMVGGLAGQLGAHAHALGEVDLVAHALIEIEHPPVALAADHLDRAIEVQHPVCDDCLLASLRSEAGPEPPASIGIAASPLDLVSDDASAPRPPTGRRAPARAPPIA